MTLLPDIADRASVIGGLRRSYELQDFEFRSDEDGKGFIFEGVASVVDAPYTVRDAFGEFEETIRAGSFNKTLKDSKADVALFLNHNTMAAPLATRSAGSLKLAADPNLRVTARLNPNRPSVQEVREAVNDGELRQMSIGFSVPKARDQWNDTYTERVISEVNLVETSIVWRGANELTSGSMRAFADLMESMMDMDMTPDEMRRMMAALQKKLAQAEDGMSQNSAEPELDSGRFTVTDEYIKLMAQRYNAAIPF